MNIYQKASTYIEKNIPIIIVSVTEKIGDGPANVGNKMIVLKNKETVGTVGGGSLEFNAIEKSMELLKSKKCDTTTYLLNEGKVIDNATTLPMACGGKTTLFYEYIGPNESIYIFGAGHCGQALTRILKTMNYHVTVIDHRSEVLDKVLCADEKVNMDYLEYINNQKIQNDSFIVIGTPSHKYDYKVIHKIIEKDITPKYMGMLCSKKKLKEFIELTQEKYPNKLDLSTFYSPIGLDLGGGSPAEIAISISAEIMAISNNKEGHKHMKNK